MQRVAVPRVPVGHRLLEHDEGADPGHGQPKRWPAPGGGDHGRTAAGPRAAATQPSSSAGVPSFTYTSSAPARLASSSSWGPAAVEARRIAGPAQLVRGRHQDDPVVPVLERRPRRAAGPPDAHADAIGLRVRPPALDLLPDQRMEQPLEDPQRLGIAEDPGRDRGRDRRPLLIEHGRTQKVDDGVAHGAPAKRSCTTASEESVAQPCRANASSAVDLPEPMPPVSPTSSGRPGSGVLGLGLRRRGAKTVAGRLGRAPASRRRSPSSPSAAASGAASRLLRRLAAPQPRPRAPTASGLGLDASEPRPRAASGSLRLHSLVFGHGLRLFGDGGLLLRLVRGAGIPEHVLRQLEARRGVPGGAWPAGAGRAHALELDGRLDVVLLGHALEREGEAAALGVDLDDLDRDVLAVRDDLARVLDVVGRRARRCARGPRRRARSRRTRRR